MSGHRDPASASDVAAILLAAGEGKRMGGPKALVLLDGERFLARAARACREGGCTTLWTVTRPGADEVAILARALGTRLVENPDPERGMFSSVQIGLRAALDAAPPPTGVIVFPVDHPRVQASTVAALLAALPVKPMHTWAQPTYEGKPGHPIAIDAATARALLTVSTDDTLRDVLHQFGQTRYPVPVEDRFILENANRPGEGGTSV